MLLNHFRLIVSCWNLLPPTVHFATWHQKFGLRSQVSRERLPSYDLETAFADILKSNEAFFLKNVCKIAFCNLHSSWETHCIETGCRGCFVILVQCCAPFLVIWRWQPPNTKLYNYLGWSIFLDVYWLWNIKISIFYFHALHVSSSSSEHNYTISAFAPISHFCDVK